MKHQGKVFVPYNQNVQNQSEKKRKKSNNS